VPRGVPDLETELAPLEEAELEPEVEYKEPPPPPLTPEPRKHRAATSSTSSRGSRSARNRQSKPEGPNRNLEKIRAGVEDMFTTTGIFCSPFLPVTGTVMISRAPRAADTIVNLCEQDARVMKAMLRMIKYNVYFECATVLGVLVVAVAVDLGQLGPDGLIPSKMIGKEIELVRAESAHSPASNGAGIPEPQWAPAG
jgi:hypothetical protein